MAAEEGHGGAETPDGSNAASRPKRVRTGCLTCRERHLKCDEGLPQCQNCRKSNRVCKRGVRLNFIDTQVRSPPITPPTLEWNVLFQDESRDIASEYKGGRGKYPALDHEARREIRTDAEFDFMTDPNSAHALQQLSLPPIQPLLPGTYADPTQLGMQDPSRDLLPLHQRSSNDPNYSGQGLPPHPTSFSNSGRPLTPPIEARDVLNDQEEVLLMQVFVEEVGLWMDSMDPMNHFSRQLPFHALGEPMLLNAFLACGARHLALVNAAYTEEKALHYYDTATRALLKSLQNPNRDTVICATTAVILNVYEVMSEKAMQRMNHIAGARALIKECGWNARSTGIGAACFWLNVGMELLSCLHFNWQVAWDPDDWGVNLDFTRETEAGQEEKWTHKMVYIVAKVANFRASIPRFQEASAHHENLRLQNRYAEWKRLKDMCDAWNENVPRTMHPLAYLYPHQTANMSSFPEVWMVKRSSITARLFYHTAMCLLAQINPLVPKELGEMHDLQLSHAHQLCGIVAHVKDRGVASVAIRSLAIAAECLEVRREQEEVLQIFDKIKKETGWRVAFLHKELKERWGLVDDDVLQQQQTNNFASLLQQSAQSSLQHYHNTQAAQAQSQNSITPSPQAQSQRPAAGIMNPLMATADFSSRHHPYQSYYVAPSQTARNSHITF